MNEKSFNCVFSFVHRFRFIIIFLCLILVCFVCFSFYRNTNKTSDTKSYYSRVVPIEVSKKALGIDISTWQGDVDFEKLKDSQVDFVMIRCGFRTLNDGKIGLDNKFYRNIFLANKYHIPVGVYFFSTAISEEEVLEEAKFLLDAIRPFKVVYPIGYDFEVFNKNRLKGLRNEEINHNARVFLDYVSSYGYNVMLYSNLHNINKHWDDSIIKEYPLWLAEYNKETTYKGNYKMVQYTNKGRVNGINGNVDMNRSNVIYRKGFGL